jgi:hypothetical protein
VEKRLLVAHHFGLCVAHMRCTINATPLVTVYQWRISICATHNYTWRILLYAPLVMPDLKIQKIQKKKKSKKTNFFLKS